MATDNGNGFGHHDGKPYHADPVYPIKEAVDVGRRVAGGAHGMTELYDAQGCLLCVTAFHGGHPEPFGAVPGRVPDVSGMSLKKLGQRLVKEGEKAETEGFGDEGSGNPLIRFFLAALVRKLIEEFLKRK